MEIILILLAVIMLLYYIGKQMREPGFAIFPFNQIREYSEGTAYAVQEKSCVAEEKEAKQN